jgi:hypothetical protein
MSKKICGVNHVSSDELEARDSGYRTHLVPCSWARQLSQNVAADAGFLCDKTAVPRYTIKQTAKNYDKF